MILEWTKHLRDEKEKLNFQRTVRSAIQVLDRVRDIFKAKVDSLERLELSPKSFETKNWELRQAYNLGYRACAQDLYTLVDLDQKQQKE
jgi:hypothetical protein